MAQLLGKPDSAKREQIMKAGISPCSKWSRKNDILHLPKEIIFNILIWLPAEFLHDNGKYVCKTWANIIRDPLFIKTHLLHSNVGLVIQHQQDPTVDRYLEVREGKFKMTHITRHFTGGALFSCEGISLVLGGDHHPMLYVVNYVTNQALKLPPLPAGSKTFKYISCIARIPRSGKIKVITPWVDLNGLYHWLVLTVGTDMSWRKIERGFTEDKFTPYLGTATSICGVIYLAKFFWMDKSDDFYCMDETDSRILAVDLHDESINGIQIPEEFFGNAYGILTMGNNLCCIVQGTNGRDVNLWILKDLYKSEWVKVHKIEAIVGRSKIWDHNHIAVAWLDSGRILIFYQVDRERPGSRVKLVAYDLKTKVRRTVRNVDGYGVHYVILHANSLVSW